MPAIKEAKTAKSPKTEPTSRRKKPLQGKALKMQVNEKLFREKGLRPFWALDEPGRINQLLDAGYRFVTKVEDGEITESALEQVDYSELDNAIYVEAAGRARGTNEPLRQYLMAIPLELHEEDMMRRRAERNDRMSQIKQGTRHTGNDDTLQTLDSAPIRVDDTTGAFTS